MKVEFEKPVLLARRQRFSDGTVVLRGKTVRIDFSYPFVVGGKACSGFDAPPCQLAIDLQSDSRDGFTRGGLARTVKRTYASLFRRVGLESFHGPEDLVVEGLERGTGEKLWRLTVSS